jgi:hypothetical protein
VEAPCVAGSLRGVSVVAGELVASARLGILDDFRVPYAIDTRLRDGRWQVVRAREGGEGLHWPADGDVSSSSWHAWSRARFWAPVLDEETVARFVGTLAGDWRPGEPVLGEDRRSFVWRTPQGGAVLPFDPDAVVNNLRTERYRTSGAESRAITPFLRRLYYAARPVLPRPLQIALRRMYSNVQRRADFPAWPLESSLHDLTARVLGLVADAAGAAVPYIGAWPDGHTWAFVLTHDVETARGRDAIQRVLAVERPLGLRSSWNLVPERYRVPDELVGALRRAGCEVGVHGLRHDGRDLESLQTLRRRLPEIRRWARRWGAVGFRAPATHRVWDWMPLLGFDYDSSAPDTDPFEPMAGGCCSWLPYVHDGVVELPITLPQDHTVFVILRRGETVWQDKAEALRRRGGMALLITHPDYLLDDELLSAYRRFIAAYHDDQTAWRALPHEVSHWWRRRAATQLRLVGDRWRPDGPAAGQAMVAFVDPPSQRAAGEAA